MKKILIALSLAVFCVEGVYAGETAIIRPEQEIKNNQTYFTANIQKQPQEKGSKQGIKNHFTFFTINVNVNGKVVNYGKSNEAN